MAGGKANYRYVDDGGVTWGVQKSKDWGSNAQAGFDLITGNNRFPPLPRRCRMRYLWAFASVGGQVVRRKFEFGKPGIATFKNGGTFNHQGLAWFTIGASVGERRFNYSSSDTGQ